MKKREKKRGNIRKDNIQERKRRKRNTLRFQSLLILFRRLDSIGSGLDQLYKNGLDLLLEHTHTHTHIHTEGGKQEQNNETEEEEKEKERERRRKRRGKNIRLQQQLQQPRKKEEEEEEEECRQRD